MVFSFFSDIELNDFLYLHTDSKNSYVGKVHRFMQDLVDIRE